MQIKTTKGPSITEQDSVFVPYAIDVSDHVLIRQAYHKIRLLNAKARHVICAYFLPGEHEKYYNRDYVDDGEHGAGRQLLKRMEDSGISNKAVFVVRVCGKEKLGATRFAGYINAAQKLLEKHPYNTITKQRQILSAPTAPSKAATTTKKDDVQKENKNGENRKDPDSEQRRKYSVGTPGQGKRDSRRKRDELNNNKKSYKSALTQ